MAKWQGCVGIADCIEDEPGLHIDQIVEHKCQGDIISTHWKRQGTDRINDDITLSNQVSIVADPYVFYHYSAITYVEYMGTKWKVTDVSVEFPRIILTVGGKYYENTTGTTE